MKRWHRGRIIDVASLGVSVVDRHGRMEGREELRSSCTGKKRENSFLYTFSENTSSSKTLSCEFILSSANLNSSYNERQWLMAIFQQTRPNETSLNGLN